MSKSISPLQLGIVWQRLTGLMDEVAQTFVRTSFSVVVRENWDLACSLMDADGRVFAQSSRSIPSFLGTMPRTLAARPVTVARRSAAPPYSGETGPEVHWEMKSPPSGVSSWVVKNWPRVSVVSSICPRVNFEHPSPRNG